MRTGNTDNAGVTGEGTVRFDDGPWHHRGKAAGDYLRNRTEIQKQSYEAEGEVRYDLDERNFTYDLARYEDDRFSGYDYEVTSSAGLGRHLVKEEGHEWTVTPGPGFRVAQPSDSESQERAVSARFTNLLSWELTDSAKVENESEAQADRERIRINNDVALKVRLVEQLSAQLSFGFEDRSDAPGDAERSDTTTRAAIVYDFQAPTRSSVPFDESRHRRLPSGDAAGRQIGPAVAAPCSLHHRLCDADALPPCQKPAARQRGSIREGLRGLT